ncbi:hypothetical protein ACHAXT_009387 [Thalassiosira profunda]
MLMATVFSRAVAVAVARGSPRARRWRTPAAFAPPTHHQPSQALHRKLPASSTRLFSTVEKSARNEPIASEGDELLDPWDVLRDLPSNADTPPEDQPTIPFPTHLSPTSLEQFSKCPQAFFFLYILKLRPDPPMTPELARGIICHTALEEVFDLQPEDRTLPNLLNLFRREWGRLRGDREESGSVEKKGNEYDVLFREEDYDATTPPDIEAEVGWGETALSLLKNYFAMEDPRSVASPNPLAREMWVHAEFTSNGSNGFVVRGKIDRIDVLPGSSEKKAQLQIIDYKTGKKPNFKYSPAVNERIANEQFWKMKVYAWAIWNMVLQTDKQSMQSSVNGNDEGDREQPKDLYKYGLSWVLRQQLMQALPNATSNPKWADVLELDSLRLFYLTSHLDDPSANEASDGRIIGKAKYMDYPLGSPSEFRSLLDQTENEIGTIAHNLQSLVDAQSPLVFEHCDWRYCSCHALRRRFHPGTVYQSPDFVDIS